MAFEKPTVQVPTTIRRVVITLVDQIADGDEDAIQKISYRLDVRDQNGHKMDYAAEAGNLVPHLTAQEITQLQAFVDSLRGRAEAAILETP